ncbi:uncharacterized protein LOC112343122 [Selaginella moellendorffii]|uniref:uncharacterized protein LOC112343122 n=1 Tax=Selaginella moellendorffii TaxID=88036 RepID=UPI000D1C38CB|nr:uncharacterized protein LOC112343122 [Selaginella moellendorffii]|eukprot:XP_024521860.1 uncharacterized protein LOC112343122 [Selaginella moellendorffii]
MKNSSAWIIGALLLASLANDASDSSLEAFAGSFVGESGYVDGPAAKSLFNRPQSLSICDNGAVFVADTRNLAIRKISKFRSLLKISRTCFLVPTVTTIAGGSSRKPGFAGDTARFSSEFSLACSCGSLLIADCGNRLIREIQIDDPKSCDSSDSAVSGSQKWALIPVVLLGVCLGMPLGAFIIWKILDQRLRQAGDQLGNTERLLADVPEDDDLQVWQRKRTC